MALDTYVNLQAAIASLLNRGDLTAAIPDFITLAEAEMKRELRRETVVASITIPSGVETYALPADCAELRDIQYQTSTRKVPIALTTLARLAEFQNAFQSTAQPIKVAVVNKTIYFAPIADQNYAARIIYYRDIQPLASNSTNTVLTEAPDIYLYGAAKHAAPYLEHDDRVALWEGLFKTAIQKLNIRREREEYGVELKAIRLPVSF